MKPKLLGLIAGAVLASPLAATAASTTYNYVGRTYDQNCGCYTSYSAFGSRMTGTVTFDFDTSCASETVWSDTNANLITNLTLKSGAYFGVDYYRATANFVLQNGQIVAWQVYASTRIPIIFP